MRQLLFTKLNQLQQNDVNFVAFFRGGKRSQKSYSELYADVSTTLDRFAALNFQSETPQIAIIGPTSYDWLVFDLACLLGGLRSVAVPETFPETRVAEMIEGIDPDLVLIDAALMDRLSTLPYRTIRYGSNKPSEGDFESLPQAESPHRYSPKENRILKNYAIAYSSGTSSLPKRIKLQFPEQKTERKTLQGILKSWAYKVVLCFSFWARRDNKILIYMPFSHTQQRDFARIALLRGINIVLSEPKNCLIHLIKEKPNILISVPFLYETIGRIIEKKIAELKGMRLLLFRLQLVLRINRLNWRNPLRRLLTRLCLAKIERLYGGRPDFFVTGSAPVSRATLDVFDSVGAQLFEAYGLSEVGVVAMNVPGRRRKGSVGKPQMKIRLSEQGEVLVQYNEKLHDKDILRVTEDGYIETGDVGYFDKDGFLYLQGRLDEVLVLANGKKVFPRTIEARLLRFAGVKHACVFSNEMSEMCVVLSVDPPCRWGESKQMIKSVNDQGANHEAIQRFHVTLEAFSADNGLLTRNLKLRRRAVVQRYAPERFLLVT